MKINIAKSSGFCFGVQRAIDIALKAAGQKKNIYMLGDIVHNEDVVAQIRNAGIKKVKKLRVGTGKTLLIRAHGIDKKTLTTMQTLDYDVIDATCPMVKEIHTIAATMEKKGHDIIVVGDKNHDEVRGIIGQLKGKAIVLDGPDRIPVAALKNLKKACAIVQSTQNLKETLALIETLKRFMPNLQFINTICRPTRLKQEEIRIMPLANDVMIIIGSKTSANTRRLHEISKSLNKRSYWVNSKLQLRKAWFTHAASVGITSGSSTPQATTKEVIDHIRRFAKAS
ncbi:MAG: 4-hydroxy-3-methylbut-2-enyl diphosphate reductase [Candidatus Omnitrophota bacterium]